VKPSVEQMVNSSEATTPTAPLEDFLPEYEADDNLWWRIACGHHQNLFEAAVDERTLADDLADVLSDPSFAPEWFAERDRVMARYREARER
jgi:hypothetical protein